MKVSVLRLALTLLLITSVTAAALAGVNALTGPMIAQRTQEQTQAAIQAVLPGGSDREITDFTDETGLVQRIYAGKQGYAFEVTPKGFDSAVTMMVGIDTQGAVLGIDIISHTETAGLGAVAAADTPVGKAFRQQFAGAGESVMVTKDGGSVDVLTGATVTSRAICTGVNAALACAAGLP